MRNATNDERVKAACKEFAISLDYVVRKLPLSAKRTSLRAMQRFAQNYSEQFPRIRELEQAGTVKEAKP